MYENKQVRGDDQPYVFLYNTIEAEAPLHFFAAQDRVEVYFVQIYRMDVGSCGLQSIGDCAGRCGIEAVV